MDSTTRLMRLGAWGATTALIGYVLLPVFRSIVEAILGTSDDAAYPRPSEVPRHEWWGIAGAIIFLLVAAGVLLLTVAAVALAEARGVGRVRALLGLSLGLGGTFGFVATAGATRAMYSGIATSLTETGADTGAQVASLWAVNIAAAGPLIVAGVTTSVFLLWFAASGMLGRGVGIAIGGLAGLLVVGEIGPVILAAQFAFIPMFTILAIVLFLRSRRRAESTHAR